MSESGEQPAIGFVGAGRAGTALALALSEAGYPITAVYSLTREHAMFVARSTGAATCAHPADVARLSEVLFLTVPDGAISAVTREIVSRAGFMPGGAVLHCSGSLPLSVLDEAVGAGTLTGVFHPLQALAGARSASLLRGSYVGVTAGPELLPVLRAMVADLGATPLELADIDGVPYHIAAVLAANYTLVLLSAAAGLMRSAGVGADSALPALLPLAHGSLANLEHSAGADGLTGPAIRGDSETVTRHLAYLREHDAQLAEVYRRLGLLALDLAERSPERDRVRRVLEG